MVDMRPGPEDTSERRLSNTWEHVPIRSYKSRDEYLFAMKEDLAEWLDNLYSIDIQPENFVEKLETGIVLCQHANSIKKQAVAWKDIQVQNRNGCSDQIRIPSEEVKYRGNAQPGTFVARDNISNFIYWCRHSLGVHDVLLFETDDLVMRKNIRSFILCLLEVARKGARFGMLVPMLIQLEQEIDREIASEVNGESSDAADDADVESEPEQEPKPRPVTVRQEPPPKPRVIMTKQDLMSLDEMVRDLVSRCTCPNQFPMIRVAEGKYRIGDSKTKIYVRILRNHVMVRVGGGWDTLEHYLDKHDPCRCLGHRSHNLYHKTTKSAPGTDRPKPSLGDRRASTAESPVRRRPSLHHTEMNRPRSAVEPSLSKQENSSLEHIPKSTSSPGNLQKPSVTRSPSRRLSEIKKAQLTATLSDSATRRTNHLSTPESSGMPNSPSSSPIPIRRSRPGSFSSHSASNSPVMQRRHGSVESASPLTRNHDGRSSLVRHPSIKKRSESPGISRSSPWRKSFNSASSSTTSTPSLSRHNSDLNGSRLSSSSNRRHPDRDKNSTSDPAFGRSHSMREKKTTPVTATSEYLKQFRKKNQISRSRSSDPDRRVASCPTSPEQNNTTTSSFSSNAKLRSVSSTSRLARPESRNAIEIYGTLGRRPRSAGGGGRERSESPATKLKDQLNISSPRVLRRARPASAKASVGRNSSSGNLKDKSTIMISRGDDGRHRLDSSSSSESMDSKSERSEMDDLLQAITSRWGSDNSKLDNNEVKLRPSNKTRASASGSTSSSARSSLDMENYNYQNYAGGSKAALARANQRSRPISRSKPSDRPRLTPKAKPQTKDESVKRMQREETRSRSIGSPKSPRKSLDTSGTRSRQIGGRGSGTVRSRSCHTEPDTLTNGMPIPRSRYLSDRDSNHLSSSVESDSSLSRLKPCFPIPQHLKIEARLHTPLRKELVSSDRPTKIPLPVHHQSNVVLRSNKPSARRNGRCFSMPDLEDRLEHSMNMPKIIKAQPRPTERDYSFSSIDSVSPTQHDSGYEDGRNDGTSKSLAARGVTESHL